MKTMLDAIKVAEQKLKAVEDGLSEVDIEQFKSLIPQFTELHRRITKCHQDAESIKKQVFSGLGSMVSASMRNQGSISTTILGVVIRIDGVWKDSNFYKFSDHEIVYSRNSHDYYACYQAMIEYLAKATPERSGSLERVASDLSKVSTSLCSFMDEIK